MDGAQERTAVTGVVVWLLTVAATATLAWPILRRLPEPEWLIRARIRGRPGVPVSAWVMTAVGYLAAWLLGERRGVLGYLLLAIWLLLPVLALWITLSWRNRKQGR